MGKGLTAHLNTLLNSNSVRKKASVYHMPCSMAENFTLHYPESLQEKGGKGRETDKSENLQLPLSALVNLSLVSEKEHGFFTE